MAVEDKYVNALVEADKPDVAAKVQGDEVYQIVGTFEIAAADDDGSVYRIAKGINPNLIPVSIEIMCDAITAGTDFDVGLYKSNKGIVLDADLLADGLTFAAAKGRDAPLDGLKDVAIVDIAKRFYELLSKTILEITGPYDIAITANTVGTAAGTVAFRILCVQG